MRDSELTEIVMRAADRMVEGGPEAERVPLSGGRQEGRVKAGGTRIIPTDVLVMPHRSRHLSSAVQWRVPHVGMNWGTTST